MIDSGSENIESIDVFYHTSENDLQGRIAQEEKIYYLNKFCNYVDENLADNKIGLYDHDVLELLNINDYIEQL